MPTLLTIARDDHFLPRGWVAAVLPAGREPSAYERSGGLFRAVYLEELPLAAKGKTLLFAGDKLTVIEDAAAFIEERRQRLAGRLVPAPGPAGLDRSHSTVWDYGPGRTYSVPQAAYLALLMQVGSQPFVETHYLRGFSGVYPPDWSFQRQLYLSWLAPSSRFPLVVDAAPGETVVFDGAGEQPGWSGVEGYTVSHVWVRGLVLRNLTYGVVPCSDSMVAREGWRVEGCEIQDCAVGVTAGWVDFLRVSGCRIHGAAVGIGDDGSLFDPGYSNPVELEGNLVYDSPSPVQVRGESPLLLVNNTLVGSGAYGLHHNLADYYFNLLGLVNNIIVGTEPEFTCIRSEMGEEARIRFGRMDGNCYRPGSGGAVAEIAGESLDLAGFQAWTGGDARSLQADPLLDPEYAPLPASPCRGAGVGWSPTGREGRLRAAAIDIGAAQVSPARVAAVGARRAPEIARKS
jgi:hypothetical protein